MRIEKIVVEHDALLIEDPTDLFYLTGLELSAGHIVVMRSGEAVLYVDGRYFEEAQEKSPIPVRKGLELQGKVGFDAGKTHYARFLELQKMCTPIAVEAPMKELRAVKDDEEIAILRRAGELCVRGYQAVLNALKEGVTEKEMVVELEIFWKRAGGMGVAFSPIIAFGENSSKPHYHPSSRQLSAGDVVLLDIGVTLEHYHSDMTRVFFFGMPDPKIEEIYQVVREAQQRALAFCRPGVTIRELDRSARAYIEEAGYGEAFVHSLGHGLGLEVHEFPRVHSEGCDRDVVLKAGMVITIEPGIYLPNKGGVRIEDCVVVTEEGYENLTECPH